MADPNQTQEADGQRAEQIMNNLIQIKNNFQEELKKSIQGEKTSLPFIRHAMPSSPLVKVDETFQVLVIGGTISKNAFVKKTKTGIKVLRNTQKDQPVFHTKESLLHFIEKELSKDVRVLALNFAYPLLPIATKTKLEGILVSGSKENTFEGLIGQNVCVEIEKYIFETRKQKILVSAANDTICLLLSGLTKYKWNNLACGIVGTGLNFALFLDQHTLVNLEAANFDKFGQTEEGKIIDAQSNQPGKALFEKETAGAYLFKKFNLRLKKQNIARELADSTKELSILSQENDQQLAQLARDVLSESADLVACEIGGISEFLQRDLTFIMEGSLFWEGYHFKRRVDESLKKMGIKHSVLFEHVHNSPIVGAAKLVA